ncbi:MAG: substrate-binding domain-containing protein [Thermodesulfobacteriota bacterium]
MQRAIRTDSKARGTLADPAIRVVNRRLGTGTRQLFDLELKNAGIKGAD